MTEAQFKALWDADPATAFQAFIVGLSQMDEQGMSAIATLEEIGISEIRLRDTLLRATNAMVLAFWDGKSRGTAYVIRKCREMSVPCTVFMRKNQCDNEV